MTETYEYATPIIRIPGEDEMEEKDDKKDKKGKGRYNDEPKRMMGRNLNMIRRIHQRMQDDSDNSDEFDEQIAQIGKQEVKNDLDELDESDELDELNNEEIINEIKGLPKKNILVTDEQKRDFFWNTISKLEWKNLSDGAIVANKVTNIFKGLSKDEKAIFMEIYDVFYNEMNNMLEHTGVFMLVGAEEKKQKAKYVSHFIAMGKETYGNLLGNSDFCQFFMENDECQNLDALFPNDMY
jgi:hypothetical protein